MEEERPVYRHPFTAEEELPRCEGEHEHGGLVQQTGELLPPEEALCDLADLFRVFGDSTRIKILYVLFENEMCVCDIASTLGMGQSAVSHHLRILKQFKLVRFRREGKSVIYALADEHVRHILGQGMDHVCE